MLADHVKRKRTIQRDINFCGDIWDRIKPALLTFHPALDWILPSIAASDDGLSLASLKKIFFNFDQLNIDEDHERFEALTKALNQLENITGSRLILRSVASVANRLEVEPKETQILANVSAGVKKSANDWNELSQFSDDQQVAEFRVIYSIHATISTGLLRAVRKEDELTNRNLYHKTYRSIARLARMRSSLIKLQVDGLYGQRKGDLRRDLLAFVALLASLDLSSIKSGKLQTNIVHLAVAEEEIFADPESELSRGISDNDRIRFAYHALFLRAK